MLSLRHYEVLVVLAEELHFGRAAERLNTSQPQLTQQLKQMEELIGTILFERNRRKVSLSPAGCILLPEARAVLRQSARAEKIAMRTGQGMIGDLALGYIGAAAYNGVLTRLLRLFREKAPDTHLSLNLMDLDKQIPEVSAGNLDAGVVRLPYPDCPSNVTFRTLSEESLWVALPIEHPLAQEDVTIQLPDLKYERFIGTHLPPHTGFAASLHNACAQANITPNIVYRSPQFASIVSLVAAGLGVAVVPQSIQNVSIPGVIYKPLTGTEVTANISLVYRETHERPALDLLLSCLNKDPTQRRYL